MIRYQCDEASSVFRAELVSVKDNFGFLPREENREPAEEDEHDDGGQNLPARRARRPGLARLSRLTLSGPGALEPG